MWFRQLLNLLASAAAIFFNGIGTTLLGKILDIVFVIIVTAMSLQGVRKRGGLAAMKEYWKEQLRQTIRVSLIAALIMYFPVVIWSVGKAVYEDHRGLVDRSRHQRTTIASDAEVLRSRKAEFSDKLRECGTESASLKGANGILTNQNRDQQNTINNCQTQALKLLAPVEQETTKRLIGDGNDEIGPNRKYEILLLTNKPVFPVSIGIRCQRVIMLASASLLDGEGEIVMLGPARRLSQNEYLLGILNPPWTPRDPIIVRVTLDGTGNSRECPCILGPVKP